MLRKFLLNFSCGIALSAFVAAVAAAAQSTPQIMLYQNHDKSKLIAKLPVNANLVQIIRQKDWIKVGDQSTGKVGWVNLQQVQKARQAYYQPDIQQVFISVDENNGKKTVNVVAYKNGKKVSDKQAQQLYQKLLKQQTRDQNAQRRYWNHFNHMMRRQQRDFDRLFRDDFRMFDQPPVIFMPGPVIQQKPATHPPKQHDSLIVPGKQSGNQHNKPVGV